MFYSGITPPEYTVRRTKRCFAIKALTESLITSSIRLLESLKSRMPVGFSWGISRRS